MSRIVRLRGRRINVWQVSGIIMLTAALIAFHAVAATQVFAQEEPAASAPAQPAPTAAQIAAGRADFMKHCAPCHGENALGHGPQVDLIPGIKPANLTKISAKNGGVFPFQSVEDTIDGRKKIPSHERFDMPFWGVNFQQEGREFTPASEAKAKVRIDTIIDYIETIQQ